MKNKKKFVYESSFLSSAARVRIEENRDLKNGICLNRNERVEHYPKNILSSIFKDVKNYELGLYPNQSRIYLALENFLKIKKQNFLLSSGIDGSLKSIIEIFLKKGDKVSFIEPSYAMYGVYSKIYKLKAKVIDYDNNNLKLNKKKIYRLIRNGIKVLFLPNPNQPIEDNFSLSEITKLCKLCKKYKVLLVIDEAYYMFGSVTAIKLIKKFSNLLILRTFSKSFGLPSVRLGYIVGDKKIISILNSYRLSYESNLLSDSAVIYFLKNIKLVKNYIQKVIRGRDYFKNNILKLGIKVIGGKSNFLLLQFDSRLTAMRIYTILLENKIYVKGNYSQPLTNCILLTCGPINIMRKVLNVIKNNIL